MLVSRSLRSFGIQGLSVSYLLTEALHAKNMYERRDLSDLFKLIQMPEPTTKQQHQTLNTSIRQQTNNKVKVKTKQLKTVHRSLRNPAPEPLNP